MIFQNMDRIVFAGDSITDMYSAQPVGEIGDGLGAGYVRIIDSMLSAVYHEISVRITNSGVVGNTSRDLLNRWERDVLSLNPQWVSVCIGINDAWRQFDAPAFPEMPVYPEEYENNLDKMLSSLAGRVKGAFVLTPYYIEREKSERLRAKMDEYGAICKRLADKYGCIFIDVQAAFDSFLEYKHSTVLAIDRIHPNQIGAVIIARAFLAQCGFDFYRKS